MWCQRLRENQAHAADRTENAIEGAMEDGFQLGMNATCLLVCQPGHLDVQEFHAAHRERKNTAEVVTILEQKYSVLTQIATL